MSGTYIVIDGMDGSGKAVVVNALSEYLRTSGKSVMDLVSIWKNGGDLQKNSHYDAIIVAEPTYQKIGKRIRETMIKNGAKYSAAAVAQAYSEDRKALMKEVIEPALKKGKIVISDRAVITSLVYQPLMKNGPSVQDLLNFPGNAYCLKMSPHLIMITLADPLVVIDRLKNRDKKDDSVFETLEFQKKIKAAYESEWLRKIFEPNKTKLEYIYTNPPATEKDTAEKAVETLKKYLN